jgi:hypothetical protein
VAGKRRSGPVTLSDEFTRWRRYVATDFSYSRALKRKKVLNEVRRFGGVAERPEIREDSRGLGQREREREAREEVRVVVGGGCIDCLVSWTRREAIYLHTVQPRNFSTQNLSNSIASAQIEAHGASTKRTPPPLASSNPFDLLRPFRHPKDYQRMAGV